MVAAPACLSGADFDLFMTQHAKSLEKLRGDKMALYPSGEGSSLYTDVEACLHVATFAFETMLHVPLCKGIKAVEWMLYSQVVAAIGKVVGASEFGEAMDYHHGQLFKEEFAPQGFCYAVRRPGRFPEGTVSIETDDDSQPVRTVVRHIPAEEATPMRFPLSAAADVTFHGDRYLHACMFQQFSGRAPPRINLVARARQFSSFILVVGKIASADVFEPECACIIKDKDDLAIPLLLETIPTPKEFADAIESLSPEQQRFCQVREED